MHRCLPLIDPNKVFRFFDLPPELRRRIYDEVLEIKTNELGERDSIFSPQLLRASKQCLAESEPFLYGRNKVTINIESELRFITSEDYYHDNISIGIGGRIVAQGGSRPSLGFPVCMAASWPACVQKARDIRIKLDAIDMRGDDDLSNLLWGLMFPRRIEECIHSRGGGFVPLWQLTASLAQAATRCKSLHIVSSFEDPRKSLHIVSSFEDPHSDGTNIKIDRVLSGMAAFANVTKCDVDTVGDPSEGARLRALILGPVPNRSEQPITTDGTETGRDTDRTFVRDSQRAWYESPALLPDGVYQVANTDGREELERGSTPELPDEVGNMLQPLLTLREPPRPRDLVLWRAT